MEGRGERWREEEMEGRGERWREEGRDGGKKRWREEMDGRRDGAVEAVSYIVQR